MAEEVKQTEVKQEEAALEPFNLEEVQKLVAENSSEVDVVEVSKTETAEAEKSETSKKEFDKTAWKPVTQLGKDVKAGKIKNIDEILDNGVKILEAEVVDILIPELESDLLLIGQSKGKFGGGQRRVFKQTQKKTREGNKPRFGAFAVVGNRNGYVGGGHGKSKETVPSREKAFRNAKLNVMKVKRGCGSWQCNCGNPHSVPFKITGKCGSSEITLMPAPKGKGLCIHSECAKILELAGIKDVWSKTKGQTKTTMNLVKACFDALNNMMETKISQKHAGDIGIIEGKLKAEEKKDE